MTNLAEGPQRKIGAFSFLLVTILVMVAGTIPYLKLTENAFVSYDDFEYVVENPHVQELSLENLKWAFISTEQANWHPLAWVSHMLDLWMYGMNPAGHHFTNLLLHLAVSLLLLVVLFKMTKQLWPSAFVAALFAAHPLHVESVAWVSERKDVLCAFFWMVTTGAYVQYVRCFANKRVAVFWYLLMLFSFGFGAMSKPMIVTLPLALALLDYWPLKRIMSKRLLFEKIPLICIAAGVCWITLSAQSQEAVVAWSQLSTGNRIVNALLAYGKYIGKILWPFDLAVFYPHTLYSFPSALCFSGWIAILLVLSSIAVLFRKRRPYLIVGWLWYLGTLIPTIGLVQVGGQAMADRYMYIPSVGLFIMFAWWLAERCSRTVVAKLKVALAAVVIVLCAVVSWHQVAHWKNTSSLFGHALDVTENNYIAHYALAHEAQASGDLDRALSQYKASLAIEPAYVEAHNNVGTVLAKLGRSDEAALSLWRAIRFDPSFHPAYFQLGGVFLSRNYVPAAASAFSRAVELQPRNIEYRHAMGIALHRLGQRRDAMRIWVQLIDEAPDNAEVQNSIGKALIEGKDMVGAEKHINAAILASPDFPEAHYNMANVQAANGRIDEALASFRRAVKLKPDYVDAHSNMANALFMTGKQLEAIAHYEIVLKLDPGHEIARRNLEIVRSAMVDGSSR